MSAVRALLERVDRYQQAHAWLGLPFSVVKKFGEDRAGNLAALIAYYGFFSLFPLLLVLVSVLGLVLRGNPELQGRVLDSALAQFPIIGDQIRDHLPALTGRGVGVALGFGTLGALWGGMGVMQAAQNAMNDVWGVPIKDRPKMLQARLRALIMLVVMGSFVLVSTLLSGLGTARGTFGPALRIAGFGGSLLLNLAIYMVGYRVLTDRRLSWRQVFWGAAFAAVVWTVLQAAGSFYVNHQLRGASELYGFFGVVLGLLGWIYLGAQVTLLGAELNVVRDRRLWPRSLSQPPLNEADRRTLREQAQVEERVDQQSVDVSFDPAAHEENAPQEQRSA